MSFAMNLRRIPIERVKRVVVKVGSNVLTARRGLNLRVMRELARQICGLMDRGPRGHSGLLRRHGLGVKKIGLERRPDELPRRQAVAAVGQAGLIMEYEKAFERHGRKVAQILLTSEDLTSRKRYLNARNTLNTLLEWKIVPIINENDTVSVEEIKLGDNDNLAAMIALLMDADLLIMLSDIDGLFTKDPRTHADAELIPVVARHHQEHRKGRRQHPRAARHRRHDEQAHRRPQGQLRRGAHGGRQGATSRTS
ncbi:MAG: glutamate 5-kinase [Desulfobacterales bacterium]|nr:glutamate 5-kinase [Desulfobacterales bacterium]